MEDRRKFNTFKPKGSGPWGAMRERLEALAVGESIYIKPGEMTEAGREKPSQFIGGCYAHLRKNGMRFTQMMVDGNLYVRRLA